MEQFERNCLIYRSELRTHTHSKITTTTTTHTHTQTLIGLYRIFPCPGHSPFSPPSACSCPANKATKHNKTHPTHSYTKRRGSLSLAHPHSERETNTPLHCNKRREREKKGPDRLFTHPTHHQQHTEVQKPDSAPCDSLDRFKGAASPHT